MKWITVREEGADVSLAEWTTALENADDLGSMEALGAKAYSVCLKYAGLEDGALAGAVAAFAHVLHHAMEGMDDALWADLRWYLEVEWQGAHATLYEEPPCATLETLGPLSMDARLTYLGGLLQSRVRPMVPLLCWAMLVSDGRKVPLRAYTELEDDDSMLVVTSILNQLVADGVPSFLDGDDAAGIWDFVRALRFGDVTADEVLRAALHRGYEVRGKKAILDLYLHSTDGVELRSKDLDTWMGSAGDVVAAVEGLKVMLLASVTAESGPLHPDMRGMGRGRR
jgi:hypothetical protein